ncbi:MAG: DUF5597 domain-containing protein [Ferruginibacter sp.]|nr:DUF5597 domain-containing protein [Chitinophagaceae bacterium]
MGLHREKMNFIKIVTGLFITCWFSFSGAAAEKTQSRDTTKRNDAPGIPHLEKRGSATQLIVKGQPFLVLGGELHNSSATSPAYMKPIWKKLTDMHLNTVLAVVSWELSEPEEGKYDFSLVDSLLVNARKNNLHLALLWFGSWKNGLSHYAPAWVKKDYKRFPRMRIKGGFPVEALTPFSNETMNADTKAFAAFMKHVKQADEREQTVIMIQVQNEVGLLGDSRDRSALADKAFNQPVPKELISHLVKNKETLLPEMLQLWATKGFRTTGTWPDIFGNTPAAEEAFMAWQYARFMNKMTEAGKAEYPLPMFVNAWIVQPEDQQPGDYPTGGPQSHVHDIWRAGAPAIDILAPDIYLPNFDDITALYTRSDNVLFVPESRADERGAANAFYAIGQHKAIGYSPFGIEDRVEDPVNGPLPKSYDVLQQLAPQILAAQNRNAIAGVWLNATKQKKTIELGGYSLHAELRRSRRVVPTDAAQEAGYGLVINTGPDEFIIAGKNIQVNFFPTTPGPAYVGYAEVDEGKYNNGKWVAGRRLNGDDIMLNYNMASEAAIQKTGTVIRVPVTAPGILHVKLYRFE